MNIEEAIKVIKNMKFDLYSGLSCNECIFDNDTKCIKENGEDCQEIAIETLLTAYEKEKETSHYNQSQLDIANAKLIEEKEKNKDLKEGYKIQEHNYQVAMEEIEQRWVDKKLL